jgi:predicted CXXCH cytochrome family protein
VAVGQCIFCHNPHRSKIEHLLIAPEPGLCYLCHDIKTIELIAAHLPKQSSACTDCHNPHTSSTKALLKNNSYRTNDVVRQPNAIKAAPQNDIQTAEEPNGQSDYKPEITTSAPVQKSESLSEVFRDSTSFTAEENGQIVRVLGMIDSVINNKEQQLETDKQYDKKVKDIADLYYNSMAFYRTGQLIRAREGFVEILNSGFIPESMAKTIRGYMSDIDNSLAKNETSEKPKQ